MRKVLSISLILLGTSAVAQDEEPGFFGRLFGGGEAEPQENQGSFLENLIEENLSGEGRTVSVNGFQGLLFGQATMESLTISDAEGIWLELQGVTLDWSRAALVRGRLDVAQLTAERIGLSRLPPPGEAAPPSPEASGFSLPELPVSVNIGRVAADRVEIGEPVFGEATVATLDGSLTLADGQGAATLSVERLDAPGSLALDASYSNETANLALDLALEEGPDGIVATLADLPGKPSLSFSVQGDDPITAFRADINFATEGEERLAGTVATSVPEDIAGASLRVDADLRGNIAPVFLPDYQTFFGDDVALVTQLTSFEDGRFTLDNLSLDAGSLTLAGLVEVGTDGLPDLINVEGAISDPGGGSVLLPLSGPETRVDEILLDVDFDASARDRWFGVFEITGLARPDFSAQSLLLDGTGQISGELDDASVSANLLVEAVNLDLGNQTATDAIGERVTGGADITWATGDPLRVTGLAINGETYNLGGYATVRTGGDGVDSFGQVTVNAEDLSAFSGVAQRDLGGSASLATTFSAQPLAGFFDVTVSGTTRDIVVSQPQADEILAGVGRLEATAKRDRTGIQAEISRLDTRNASVSGQASLATGGSSATLEARLTDAGLLSPELSGPVTLEANASQDGDVWQWSANGDLEGSRFDAEGTATDLFGTPAVTAEGTLAVADLSDFADLARRDLGGAIEAGFTADVVADLSRAAITLDATTTDLRVAQEQADTLMAGPVTITLDGGVEGGTYAIRNTRIAGRNLTLDANGSLGEASGELTASGRISDASLLLDGAPEGPITLTGTTSREGNDWSFDVDLMGPGVAVDAEGVAIDPTGSSAALQGKVTARAEDLSIFSELANRPLNGNLSVDTEGDLTFDLADIDIAGSISGSDLSVGQAELDQLLAGGLSVEVDVEREGDVIDIGTLALTTNLLDIDATGSLGETASEITLDAELGDIAPFVAGFNGPVTINGSIGQDGTDANIVPDLTVDGPGSTEARLSGEVAADFSDLDIDLVGQAPIGIINQLIQPRSFAGGLDFEIAVDGPPSIESVSGVISTSGTRLVDPSIRLVIEDFNGNVTLNEGSANIDISGRPRDGGLISIGGPINLSPPLNADLTVQLDSAGYVDPRLFETQLDGTISLAGALLGGASISGDIVIGNTNIRIPSSSLGSAGGIPEIIHVNEPAAVRATRQRAGLIQENQETAERAGPVFPLDIRITAPGQVFVRGRGLDSEFEGELSVTGTTADVIPLGGLNLVRGRLDILGQRLVIEEAVITMQGTFVPALSIVAAAESDEYDIEVLVSGPANNPDISFTSSPPLPEDEVLARLLFGRGLETLSPFQAARLAVAVATLSGQSTGPGILGSVRDQTGIADLDLRVNEEGQTEVSAGAYLTENIYSDVTVETRETIFSLNIDLTPTITVKGSTSTRDKSSIGIFFERDY